MALVTKRSSMTYFSDPESIACHRVRIVLAEKAVQCDVQVLPVETLPEDVQSVNPYGELPLLIDRELVLFHPVTMMEYLDERFPHPPLMSVMPVERAQARQLFHRIDRDWVAPANTILEKGKKEKDRAAARKQLTDSLLAVSPIFEEMPWFMSKEFSLIDCMVAPLLWRLPLLGVDLPARSAKGINAYMQQLFARESIQESLSDDERKIRQS
jgi:RNA polymerase-associated protein